MKTMKMLVYYLIAFNLLLISDSVFGQDKAEIGPFKFLEKKIIKGKDEYSYYTLSQKAPTTYRIEGPGKFFINSRVELTGKDSKSEVSGIKIVQSQSLIKTFGIPELLLDDTKSNENDFPSKMHRIEIDVPPGEYSYRIFSADAKQRVYVRGLYEAYPKPMWKDLVPVNKPEKREVRFGKSKKVQEYYEVKKKDGYQFFIHDTTQIRIVIRPAFDNKMLDDTKISVNLINKNTGKEQIYKFSSARANDVEFTNDSRNIPGKSAMFYVNLPKPKGKNDIYDIQFLSGAKSVVMRVSINKKLIK